jgi:chromate transporter
VNVLPGPGATQLGIFVGYDRAGWRGGLVAGLCFILPAFFIMLALTLFYSAYGAMPALRGAFYGLGPVVLGIFIVAVYRLGRNALQGRSQFLIAVLAALAVAFTPLGIVATLLLAGSLGVMLYQSKRTGAIAVVAILVLAAGFHWAPAGGSASAVVPGEPSLWDIGSFFFKVGALTFGGGLTVLGFIQEQVVNRFHWLTPQEFLDGLALGQLTPGPILMLAAYVGHKLAGIAGAIVGAGAIFLPAFIVMLTLLPVLARLRHLAWLKAAMRGIGAAVIGAISVSLLQMAPHAVPDAFTFLVMVLAVAAMTRWRVGPLPLMLGGACVGTAIRLHPLQRLKELV